MPSTALIVQWIEQLRPKEKIWVRLLVRAQTQGARKGAFVFVLEPGAALCIQSVARVEAVLR